MEQNALIVFAKNPVAGQVKTRLTTLLAPEDAAALYEAFVRDALSAYRRLPARVLAFVSAGSAPVRESLFSPADSLYEQEGRNLGERMCRAFRKVFQAGYDRAVVIGTDHPTLPLAFVERAFEALDEAGSVCIGPSEDGGYYLLGMNRFYPALFEKMQYSHPRVLEQTLDRAGKIGCKLAILPVWYDVDTVASLRRLAAELHNGDYNAVHTAAAVKQLIDKYADLMPRSR